MYFFAGGEICPGASIAANACVLACLSGTKARGKYPSAGAGTTPETTSKAENEGEKSPGSPSSHILVSPGASTYTFSWRQWPRGEKAMAPHSSTLAWQIPWTEGPGRLQSMGSLRVDRTERLHFHFSLSCIGEGNGNPLQCSCLEKPRDGGAWWAAVSGTRLR